MSHDASTIGGTSTYQVPPPTFVPLRKRPERPRFDTMELNQTSGKIREKTAKFQQNYAIKMRV